MILVSAALAAPIPRDRPGEVMPDRDWDFVHLDLRVDLAVDEGRLEGEATWRIAALGAPDRVVRLHQAGLDVRAVEVDGAPVEAWRVVGDWLEVPVAPERDAHTLVIRYAAAPQTGLHFRGGPGSPPGEVREVWSQGEGADNRHWFPLWDYPNDRFTVTTTVVVPEDLTAFANGRHVGTADAGDGKKAWTYAMERPITGYLVAIAAGEYRVIERSASVPLVYAAPRTVPEADLLRTLGRTEPQLAFLEGLLGEPYPYAAYRQVLVQRYMYGGMENAGLSILHADVRVRSAHAPDDWSDTVIAHELAHQWFGDLLTCYGWRELWLNEGFATFYAGRWQEHDQGPARMAELVRKWTRQALEDRDAPMAARAHTKVGARENAAVYVRGAAVLHMLRVWLGDAVFDAGVRRYVAENRDRYVETEDLRRALEEVSGRHLGWLFDQWVTGAGAATLTTAHRWSEGQLEVTVVQADGAGFSAPVEVEIGAGGSARIERAWLGPGTTRLVIPLAEAPRYVAVDPRGGVLAEWKHEQPTAAWVHQAKGATAPFARLVAIDALGDGPAEPLALEALRAIATDRGEPVPLRVAAAAALGRTRLDDAVAALEPLTRDPEIRVRIAAVEALGALALPERDGRVAVEAVARSGAADPDERAAALKALGQLDAPAARQLARAWLDRPDPTTILHEAAAELLRERGEKADLPRLVARIDEARTPSATLKAAAAAAVALAGRVADARAEEDLARRLDALLRSRDIRIRQAAIGWLGAAGDERSAQALAAFADRNRVAWSELSDRALDAARLIRARRDPATPIPPDDLKRLQERIAELERRLETLETWH